MAIPLFTGCVGYVYDGGVGVGVGVGYGGGWGGGWRRPAPGWGGGWGGGYHGGWRRPAPGWGGGHHGGWGRRFAMGLENFSLDQLPEVDSDVQGLDEAAAPQVAAVGGQLDAPGALSRNFQIRYDSAQKIIKLASGKVSKKFCKQMGLIDSDLDMLKTRQISEDTVVRVANALNEEPWKIQNLANGFLADTAE